MNDREAFMRTIIDEPDEDTPRLVFADWLQENGDEDRANLIRMQCELARKPFNILVVKEAPSVGPGSWTNFYKDPNTKFKIGELVLIRRQYPMTELFVGRIKDCALETGVIRVDFVEDKHGWIPQYARRKRMKRDVFSLLDNNLSRWRYEYSLLNLTSDFVDVVKLEPTFRFGIDKDCFSRGMIETVACRYSDWYEYGEDLVCLHPLRKVIISDKEPMTIATDSIITSLVSMYTRILYLWTVNNPPLVSQLGKSQVLSDVMDGMPLGERLDGIYPEATTRLRAFATTEEAMDALSIGLLKRTHSLKLVKELMAANRMDFPA